MLSEAWQWKLPVALYLQICQEEISLHYSLILDGSFLEKNMLNIYHSVKYSMGQSFVCLNNITFCFLIQTIKIYCWDKMLP